MLIFTSTVLERRCLKFTVCAGGLLNGEFGDANSAIYLRIAASSFLARLAATACRSSSPCCLVALTRLMVMR